MNSIIIISYYYIYYTHLIFFSFALYISYLCYLEVILIYILLPQQYNFLLYFNMYWCQQLPELHSQILDFSSLDTKLNFEKGTGKDRYNVIKPVAKQESLTIQLDLRKLYSMSVQWVSTVPNLQQHL